MEAKDLIGNTPLVYLRRFSPGEINIYAKLEKYNLTGSVKDRIALSMIERAEEEGRLRPGYDILEPTSGNTGISLATLSAIRGYRFHAVVPENATRERIEMMRAAGAEIIFSPGEEGSNGAVRLAKQMMEEHPYFVGLDQYENPANPDAHYRGTAEEIVRDLPEIDTFVAGLGTGGTLMGTSRRLREHNPHVTIVAAEPYPGEAIQGLRSMEEGYIPPIFDASQLDRKLLVRSSESIRLTQDLMRREGLFMGISCGTALAAAIKVSGPANKNIVVLFPDGGDRYLSSGIFSADPEKSDIDVSTLW